MSVDDKFDIYGDLNDFDASVKLKEVAEELEALQRKHSETLKSLEASEAVNKHVRSVNVTVKKNFSILLTTARTEIKRKDTTITQLRRDYDDMAFRRSKKGKPQNANKATQTEREADESSRRRENGFREERNKKNRYDRFKDSLREQGSKRRHEENNKDAYRDAKRRRSRPRSSSRDRNRRESNRRHRDSSREKREDKTARKSREKSEKSTRKEEPVAPEVPKKIYQENQEETIETVQNILVSQQECVKDVVESQQEELQVPEEVPKATVIAEEPPQSLPEAEKTEPTEPVRQPDEELPLNRSINLGNSDYSIGSDSQGIVTVVIKRKKRSKNRKKS